MLSWRLLTSCHFLESTSLFRKYCFSLYQNVFSNSLRVPILSFSRCLIFKVLCAVLVDSFSSLTHSFEFVNPFLQEFFPFSFRLFFLPAASRKQKRFLSYHTSHLLSRTFFILFSAPGKPPLSLLCFPSPFFAAWLSYHLFLPLSTTFFLFSFFS